MPITYSVFKIEHNWGNSRQKYKEIVWLIFLDDLIG